ncbi:MAG: hypothetical protein [Olavius algarvensis Delta 4 endosymbiont]|nr:MAG: hypothetical protein [Olavius algarvensis Delta 4 endosymbiont]
MAILAKAQSGKSIDRWLKMTCLDECEKVGVDSAVTCGGGYHLRNKYIIDLYSIDKCKVNCYAFI